MATKIRYVQLEPAEVLLDFHSSRMTAEQFGCYWLIMMHLYCQGGKLKLDVKELGLLCNCPGAPGEGFEKVWEKIESKFQKKGGQIKHKRVNRELRRARQRRQAAVDNGLRGAQARWQGHSAGITLAMANGKRNVIEETESKLRIRKDLSSSPFHSLVPSSSLRHPASATAVAEACETPGALAVRILDFNQSLQQIIRPRNQSDRTSFRNIGNWLMVKIQAGEFNERIIPRVLEYAAEAVKGKSRNPAAVFTSILKRELKYLP